jgi:hypothetical protein
MGSSVVDVCSMLKKIGLCLLVSFVFVIILKRSLFTIMRLNRNAVRSTDVSYKPKKLLVREHSVINFIAILRRNLG